MGRRRLTRRRGSPSWTESLALTALAALVAVAAVDAVRNREPDERPPTPTALDDRDALADRLEGLRADGELVLYGSGCAVRLVLLPSLKQTEDLSGCAPHGATSPDRSLVARCLGERTELFEQGGGVLVRTLPGCAPAWRPDGMLTVARNGDVVQFLGECPPGEDCTRTLIERSELERAARRHPTMPQQSAGLRVLVEGIAWLSPRRAAVQLSIRGGRIAGIGALSQIAFFDDGRLTATQPYFRMTGGRIAASSRGTYLTMAPDVVLRQDGTQVNLPQHLRDARAFAWSPDERTLAVATRFAVIVVDVASLERYDVDGGGLRSVTLPVSVTELAWR